MAIEPLLALLRRRVQGIVGLELGFKDPIMVSAYADDVSVMVKNEKDLQAVVGTLQTYQRASSAKVNWGKSEALLCGVWRKSEVPQLPEGLQWSREGLRVLGVYLGSEGWVSRSSIHHSHQVGKVEVDSLSGLIQRLDFNHQQSSGIFTVAQV